MDPVPKVLYNKKLRLTTNFLVFLFFFLRLESYFPVYSNLLLRKILTVF